MHEMGGREYTNKLEGCTRSGTFCVYLVIFRPRHRYLFIVHRSALILTVNSSFLYSETFFMHHDDSSRCVNMSLEKQHNERVRLRALAVSRLEWDICGDRTTSRSGKISSG